MNIDNLKNICVGGWGKTGISLCNLLLALNKRVRVSEMKERGSFPSSMVDSFIEKGVKIEFGGHTKNFIKGSQLLVISP
ncbi:MAG: UDP-N-acetylmuramoyl-L-alanine--D-glutamate ligase, partial [Candidatus Omnitrophica bacterium]|nr:UDP-N-acetylmuramoyl-L-alanine--D-glutamate ligase [Candidatus Omnitrophota bacterium]